MVTDISTEPAALNSGLLRLSLKTVAVLSFETIYTEVHGAILQNTELFMNTIMKTTYLSYQQSFGERTPEGLGAFVKKTKVSSNGSSSQMDNSQHHSYREIRCAVKC